MAITIESAWRSGAAARISLTTLPERVERARLNGTSPSSAAAGMLQRYYGRRGRPAQTLDRADRGVRRGPEIDRDQDVAEAKPSSRPEAAGIVTVTCWPRASGLAILLTAVGIESCCLTEREAMGCGLQRVIDRFPEFAASIRDCFDVDQSFREMCGDYTETLEALQRWQASDSPQRLARIEEYRELAGALEVEIVAALQPPSLKRQ